MRYQLAIFDFDGTLANSFPFFAGIFNALAAKHGFRPIDASEIPALRGRTPHELMQHVGLPAWKLPLVARSFVAAMRDRPQEISLFDGVPEAINALASAGVQLAIVSSNAEDNVRRILGPAVAGHFAAFECGMSIFGKATRIERVMQSLAAAPAHTIYVGDQTPDAGAAQAAGVAFAAVAWGYGSIESLRALQPALELAKVTDIVPALSGPAET